MSPQTGSRRYTHTHLNQLVGTLAFSKFPLQDFSFFYFCFLCVRKKYKNANKRISNFFPLRCFLSTFLFLFAYLRFCAFAWLRFCAFWCFLRVQNLLVKKKKLKTALKFKNNLIYVTTVVIILKSCIFKSFEHIR